MSTPNVGSHRGQVRRADLADLLRMNRLPGAWIAPPAVRELRELVRHRAKLVALRTGLTAQVHAVLAKQGLRVRVSELFGVAGRALLEDVPLDPVYRGRVNSLLRLIDACGFEIAAVSTRLTAQLIREPGYQALLALPGVGPVLAGVFFAEIGDVHRPASTRGPARNEHRHPRHRSQAAHPGLLRPARGSRLSPVPPPTPPATTAHRGTGVSGNGRDRCAVVPQV
jgi:transposase